jgi:hypothetical protein
MDKNAFYSRIKSYVLSFIAQFTNKTLISFLHNRVAHVKFHLASFPQNNNRYFKKISFSSGYLTRLHFHVVQIIISKFSNFGQLLLFA